MSKSTQKTRINQFPSPKYILPFFLLLTLHIEVAAPHRPTVQSIKSPVFNAIGRFRSTVKCRRPLGDRGKVVGASRGRGIEVVGSFISFCSGLDGSGACAPRMLPLEFIGPVGGPMRTLSVSLSRRPARARSK